LSTLCACAACGTSANEASEPVTAIAASTA
jgi:hypothetical protein